MPPNRPCLVIAQSGRALAVSAARANIKTHVIDLFADEDTRYFALTTHRLSGNSKGLDAVELSGVLNDYLDVPLEGVVVGSGLESNPELLDIIGNRIPLFGNGTECVRKCKDPVYFFDLLDSFGIAHPETRVCYADYSEEWLVKQIGGAGGQHIGCAGDIKSDVQDQYFQRYVAGRSVSVVFMADGRQAYVLGQNETWTRNPDKYDFCYAGAVTLPELDKSTASILVEVVNILVENLELVGLCGLDVIIDADGECKVLEVNPRPPATFQLHEDNLSLFLAHVMACGGRLIQIPQITSESRGHEILFAPAELSVPETVWPEWAVDRPAAGHLIASGEPICTILAAAGSPDEVRILLEQRKASMYKLLGLQRIAA